MISFNTTSNLLLGLSTACPIKTMYPGLFRNNSRCSLILNFLLDFSLPNRGVFRNVSRYSAGLRAGQLGFDSLQRQNFSLLHSFQTDSGAYPASYTMGTAGSLAGGKAAGA
jgi:hypothetical protein